LYSRKIETRTNWQRSNYVFKIKGFLGLAKYRCRFVEGYSRLAVLMPWLAYKKELHLGEMMRGRQHFRS